MNGTLLLLFLIGKLKTDCNIGQRIQQFLKPRFFLFRDGFADPIGIIFLTIVFICEVYKYKTIE